MKTDETTRTQHTRDVMWMTTTNDRVFYGKDADLVAKAAKKHEWVDGEHCLEDVTMGELSDWMSRDWRPATRVYTEEEKRGVPQRQ